MKNTFNALSNASSFPITPLASVFTHFIKSLELSKFYPLEYSLLTFEAFLILETMSLAVIIALPSICPHLLAKI